MPEDTVSGEVGERDPPELESWLSSASVKGFHLGELAPSASAQQGYMGLQLQGRERLIIQPRHLAEDRGGTPSQSKVLRIEMQVSFYTGEKSGNFPESRGWGYWSKREKKKTEQDAQDRWLCGRHLALSCQPLSPGWARTKGVAQRHTCPQRSDKERGHSANPKREKASLREAKSSNPTLC